jgi:hypothetical protein
MRVEADACHEPEGLAFLGSVYGASVVLPGMKQWGQ